jgi:TonB-linked SusC/RagA family outer membrane protein
MEKVNISAPRIFGLMLSFFLLTGSLLAQTTQESNKKVILTDNLITSHISQDPNPPITLELDQVSLEKALKKIARQARAGLYYNSTFMPDKTVSLNLQAVPLGKALRKVLKGTSLEIVTSGRNITLRKKLETDLIRLPLASIQETITGTVTDGESGETLPGVNILVKGTSTGTSTNANGDYELTVESLQDTLVFSFIGYQQESVPINGRTEVDIEMQSQAIMGEDVIVTGYMEQNQADVTGSISKVSSEDIENTQYSSVAKSLQGKVPGMTITTDGDPVGNAEINIRGITSVNANPPLIVVDGLPTQLDLNDINSGDIASIQVLKDAASASIYGSRAASGVILIETKEASRGQTTVNYKGSAGGSKVFDHPDLLNTQQYGRALWQAAVNDGLNPNEQTLIYNYEWHENADGQLQLDTIIPRQWLNEEETMPSGNTDWFEEGLRTGLQQKHQITVSNGTDVSRTLFSMNYFQNDGPVMHSGLKRYSARLNSDYDLINDKLKIGENIALSHKNFNSGVNGSIRNMLIMPSIVPVYTNTGQWGGTAYDYGMDDYNNPIRELDINKDNRDNETKLVGSVFAELQPMANLVLKTQLGMDYTTGYFRHVNYTWQESGGKQDVNNGVFNDNFRDLNFTLTNTINYKISINSAHTMEVLGGMELFRHSSEFFNANREDIEIESRDYAFLNTATGNMSVNGSGNEYAMVSYFSKLNYDFKSKYLLSGTFRYDGSSVFGENNRYAFFPALSAGWRISNESFLAENSLISDLKLRASWGKNGNSNIPATARYNYYDSDYYSTSYAINGQENGQLSSGFRKIQSGNDDLQWEETTQFTLGLDYGLLENKISGSIDLYSKQTDGMLFYPPSLAVTGEGAGRWLNAADMTNKGIEFLITYSSNTSSNFNYSISANASMNRNKINNLPEEVRFAYGGNGVDDDIQGRPLNSFYGFVADGLFETQEEVNNSAEQQGKGLGRIRYKDLNNDGEITYEEDRKWIGNSDPKITYGINFDSDYKNFDLSMFWQGVAGNDVRNDWKTYSDFWNIWTQAGMNHSTRILDAWSPTNRDSNIPALSLSNANDERRLSTYFMESGSYLSLRNIELGYSLSQTANQRIGAKKMRVFISAQNLLNITKWWGDNEFTGLYPETSSKDGEYSNPYMRPQIFMAGIDITF